MIAVTVQLDIPANAFNNCDLIVNGKFGCKKFDDVNVFEWKN